MHWRIVTNLLFALEVHESRSIPILPSLRRGAREEALPLPPHPLPRNRAAVPLRRRIIPGGKAGSK
jgi:hypothetical protein